MNIGSGNHEGVSKYTDQNPDLQDARLNEENSCYIYYKNRKQKQVEEVESRDTHKNMTLTINPIFEERQESDEEKKEDNAWE